MSHQVQKGSRLVIIGEEEEGVQRIRSRDAVRVYARQVLHIHSLYHICVEW